MHKFLSRPIVWTVVLAVLVIGGTAATSDSEPEFALTEEDIAAQAGDANPFGHMGGLTARADAIVVGRVIGRTGPRTSLNEHGLVYWKSNPDAKSPHEGLPGLIVEISGVLDNAGELSINNGSRVTALNSDGHFEEGREYALFLGSPFDPDTHSVLYGHDLVTDLPAAGLAIGGERILEPLAEITSTTRQETLDILVQFNKDIDNTSLEKSLLFEVVMSGPLDDHDDHDDHESHPLYYPHYEDEATKDEQVHLQQVEFYVVGEPGIYYGLRGERDLVWFGADESGIAVGTGFVQPGEDLELISAEVTAEAQVSEASLLDVQLRVERSQEREGISYFWVDSGARLVTHVSTLQDLDMRAEKHVDAIR